MQACNYKRLVELLNKVQYKVVISKPKNEPEKCFCIVCILPSVLMTGDGHKESFSRKMWTGEKMDSQMD